VLKRRDAGESDRRLTLLTEEVGVIDAVAKGARKGASRLAGSTEPLSVCILQLAEGKRTRYITQTQPITSFPGLREDFDRLMFALAMGELASAVLPHGQEAKEEFRFLIQGLRYLEVHPKPIVAFLWAELRLMAMAGFQGEFNQCIVTGESLQEGLPWVSPHAGGYVCAAMVERFSDRFQVRAEALIGASRLVELEEPPQNLKFADETLQMLARFWRVWADDSLPTHRQIVERLLQDR
jgi:DNA repair protein RecO (recombination protein O)